MNGNVISVHYPVPDKHGNAFNWSLRIQVKQIMLTKSSEDNAEVLTRRQFKKEKKQKAKGKHVKRRRRVFPIWLRIIVMSLHSDIAFIICALIVYIIHYVLSTRD